MKYTKELATRLRDLWDENEEAGSGEMASLYMGCDMLGIPHEDAFDVLALLKAK